MERFDLKGITGGASVAYMRTDYKDLDGRKKLRFERCLRTHVCFWDFRICDDLFKLASVRSVFIEFLIAVGKKGAKAGRVELTRILEQSTQDDTLQKLVFTAKQKNDEYYLHILLTEDGKFMSEVYLDEHEVRTLDLTFAKIINLMSPYEYDFVADLVGSR